MADTIYALSSGPPPAAIAIIRICGPNAKLALSALAGRIPVPRRATVMTLRDDRDILDRAVVIWLPGPHTQTGEDMAELHCHGGRAVVRAVERALSGLPDIRMAEAGEFTRRAFANGQIDLAEAEALADLLAAETELQRRGALAGENVSRETRSWRDQTLALGAQVEAVLDFGEEDGTDLAQDFGLRLAALNVEISKWLVRPKADRLRDGVRVVIAGPPNIGKSTLFNALVEADAAIVTPVPGTTRDVLERPAALGGVPFVFADTAGLRVTEDPVEAIGVQRAAAAAGGADIVLWLGPEGEGPPQAWEIQARADDASAPCKVAPRNIVSAYTGVGLPQLRGDLIVAAAAMLPAPGEAALNARQHHLLSRVSTALTEALGATDLLVVAEGLRVARLAFDMLLGNSATEDMLDALFGRFCIGK